MRTMEILYHDYEFQTEYFQNAWRCIRTHTFENMELYLRKQLSMQQLLSNFKKAFQIAPVTVKNLDNDEGYKYKFLAIYLLTHYSKERFEDIAIEFKISKETVCLIFSNNTYRTTMIEDIKLFFKQLEEDYLYARKASLSLQEKVSMDIKTS